MKGRKANKKRKKYRKRHKLIWEGERNDDILCRKRKAVNRRNLGSFGYL